MGEGLRAEDLHILELVCELKVERIEKSLLCRRDGGFPADETRRIRHGEDEILGHEGAPSIGIADIDGRDKVVEQPVECRQIFRQFGVRAGLETGARKVAVQIPAGDLPAAVGLPPQRQMPWPSSGIGLPPRSAAVQDRGG